MQKSALLNLKRAFEGSRIKTRICLKHNVSVNERKLHTLIMTTADNSNWWDHYFHLILELQNP